jgi:hypothetical protein
VFEVDASDVVGGAYELAVAAPPTRSASASVSVRHAPVRLSLRRDADSITAEVAALDSVAGDLLVLLTGAERRVTVRASGGAEQRLDVGIPGWARSAVIDVRHPGGQWERFTDFGVTLLRADGSIVEQSPMNYAFGRLAFDVPPSDTAARATLSLLPGLADPASEMPWAVEVAIRFYADTPVALADAQGGAVPLRLAPGERRRIRHPLVAAPWPLGEGFHPLAVLAVQTGDAIWSREAGLPGPASSGE